MKVTRLQAFVVLLIATYLPYLVGFLLRGKDRLNWFKHFYLLPFALLSTWTNRSLGLIIIPSLWLVALIYLPNADGTTRSRLIAMSTTVFAFGCVIAYLTYQAFLA